MDRHNIRNIHWQMAMVKADAPLPANIVTDFADIEQEIRTVIMTPIGSVPCNPLKGCDILPLIDMPGAIAAPLAAQRIHDALTRWVRRIEAGMVSVEPQAVHCWRIIVPWRVRDDVRSEFETLDFNLSFDADSSAAPPAAEENYAKR